MQRGKLIVIEGTDGSGKETQTKALIARLQEETTVTVKTFDFPDYKTPTGNLVKRYLDGVYGKDVHPELAGALYALDRATKLRGINTILNAGGHVVVDRYVLSNSAYQGGRLETEEEKHNYWDLCDEIEHGMIGLPEADLTIFLDVPPEKSRALLKKRGQKLDAHEQDTSLGMRARQNYLELIERYEGVRINCIDPETNNLRSIKDIADEIWDIAKPCLGV